MRSIRFLLRLTTPAGASRTVTFYAVVKSRVRVVTDLSSGAAVNHLSTLTSRGQVGSRGHRVKNMCLLSSFFLSRSRLQNERRWNECTCYSLHFSSRQTGKYNEIKTLSELSTLILIKKDAYLEVEDFEGNSVVKDWGPYWLGEVRVALRQGQSSLVTTSLLLIQDRRI